MGVSYDIYLHDLTHNQKKPTQPKKQGGTNTSSKSNDSSGAKEMGLIKAATTTAGKVALAVYAAEKISDKVVNLIEPFVTRETGDYRFSVAYHNVKQMLNNAVNPIGYFLRRASYYQEMRIANDRQEQERLLVGDAYINSISRKV